MHKRQNHHFSIRTNRASLPNLHNFIAKFLEEFALSLSLKDTFHAVLYPTTLLHINASIKPAPFSNELNYLYKGRARPSNFCLDSLESCEHPQEELEDPEALPIDKLRKDLVTQTCALL
jgi:hypothetical protein